MKLQHLAVIFVLIIVPISLVLSSYINTQIKTIEQQTKYTTMLINSTYDAARAFQLNTFNNRFSTLNDSKMRDIEAAITTFYRTLAVNLGMSTYSKNELQQTKDIQTYTPAVLCTLYDGFYIYTKYKNESIDDSTGKLTGDDYIYGLKPSIEYSCRYVKGSDYDFIVNYTLDNTITVIGKVNGEFVTKTGHLIAGTISEDETNVNGITIGKETLKETLITIDSANPNGLKAEYDYIIYNNDKIYREIKEIDVDGNPISYNYFRYGTDYRKNYIYSITDDIWNEGCKSAINYYKEAKEFTEWAKVALSEIKASNAVDTNGNQISFSTNTGTSNIFEVNTTNNPLVSGSTFNEHRMNVIRYNIEKNLSQAINTYSEHAGTGIEYAMPQIEEDKWYEIENNVCFVTFLQGLPIGTKMYNNYCVVSNNTNQETVGVDSVYIIDSNKEYHRAGCKTLHNALNNSTLSIQGAYASSDFERKGISLSGSDANAHTQINDFLSESGPSTDVAYFFPQTGYTACYDCIVNMADTYSIDDVVKGGDVKNEDGNTVGTINDAVRKVYLTALARCRYNLYTINGYFGY